MRTRYAVAAGWLVACFSAPVQAQFPDVVATIPSVPSVEVPAGKADREQQEAVPDMRGCEFRPATEGPQQYSVPETPACDQLSAATRAESSAAASDTNTIPFDLGPRSSGSVDNAASDLLLGAVVGNAVSTILDKTRLPNSALTGGNRVGLDLVGDGLIIVYIDPAALQSALAGTDTVQADGSIILSPRSTDKLLDTVVNTEGVTRATSLTERDGSAYLGGGTSGAVAVTPDDGVALASIGSVSNVFPPAAGSSGSATETTLLVLAPSPSLPPVDYAAPPFSVPPVGAEGTPIVIAPPVVVPPSGSAGGGTPIVITPPVTLPPPGSSTDGTPVVSPPPVVVVVPPPGNGGRPIVVPAVSAPRGENGAGRPFVVGIPGNTPAGTPAATGITGRPPFAGGGNGNGTGGGSPGGAGQGNASGSSRIAVPIVVPPVSAPSGENGAGRPFVNGRPGNAPAGTPASSGVTGRPAFAGASAPAVGRGNR